MDTDYGNRVLQQLACVGNGPVPAAAKDEFHAVASAVAQTSLSRALVAAFDSPQTPSFGEMVAQMFSHANPEQKAGIVNRLLSGCAPML